MLMLAHQKSARIDGIEIDADCFQQLKENIQQSNWSGRIAAHHGDIRTFQSKIKYDLIVSNPPFHENSLSSPSASTNLARHSAELKLEELINDIDRLLSDKGSFAVLLPYYRSDYFEELAKEKSFYLAQKLLVKQSPNHKYFRSILHFSRYATNLFQKELVIQNESREYTNEFIQLLKDYYLYL